MASILTIPLCVLFGRMNHHNGELLKAASAESLGRLHVRESIGPLAARLFDPSQVVSEAAAAALLRILPRLHEEDYGTIDHMALSHLADGLNHPNALLVFKILGALRMVGTGHTLPAVERIAREGKTRQIQESARSVAIVLEERRRREQESRHLMRSTSLTESLNDSLLHPYAAGSVQETIQLSSQARSSQDWL